MADLNASTGTLGNETPAAGTFPNYHAYYEREFLEIANPMLVYDKFGMVKNIPSNSSNRISFTKVFKLAVDPAARLLSEGITPTEQQFQMETLHKDVNQYGGFAITTDRLHEESINNLTSEFNKRIAEQAGETMNLVVRDDLLGGTNVRFANGVADQDSVVSGPVAADYNYMFTSFKNEKVKFLNSMTTGSPNYGTTAISASYVEIVPIEAASLIESLDDGLGETFTPIKDYNGQVSVYENEHGSFKNFRFILDTEASQVLNATSGKIVAQALVFGKGAYAISAIASKDIELIIKPLGSSGVADALNQRASLGWKARKAAVIVQPTYMFRHEFALD